MSDSKVWEFPNGVVLTVTIDIEAGIEISMRQDGEAEMRGSEIYVAHSIWASGIDEKETQEIVDYLDQAHDVLREIREEADRDESSVVISVAQAMFHSGNDDVNPSASQMDEARRVIDLVEKSLTTD